MVRLEHRSVFRKNGRRSLPYFDLGSMGRRYGQGRALFQDAMRARLIRAVRRRTCATGGTSTAT